MADLVSTRNQILVSTGNRSNGSYMLSNGFLTACGIVRVDFG